MVAEFEERQRTIIAQHEAAAQAKHAEKAAAAAQTVSEAAATSAAAARVGVQHVRNAVRRDVSKSRFFELTPLR
jgi:hypothetical protein